MKTRWVGAGMVLALGFGGLPSWGQVIERERDVTITGPRGRTIQRDIKTERGPGFVDRQINIQRPGGSFHSNAAAMRIPGGMPGGGRGYFAPRGWGGGGWGPRGVLVERPVVVNNGLGVLPALGIGAGMFGLGMFAGSAMASSPPPVVAAPAVVVPAAPPTVIYNAPQPYSATPPPPATVVVDPVAAAAARLKSYHANSRKEGAYTLGRLRDPRALPPLIYVLKNDMNQDVRVAAALALGEIGDPRAALPLEQAVVYEKKQVVKDAANQALSRLPREAPVTAQPGTVVPSTGFPTTSVPAATTAPGTNIPSAAPIENVPPPPTPVIPNLGSQP